MKNLKALRQRQAELKQRGKALLDLAATEKRDLTEAEEHEFIQLEADLAAVETDITAAERDAERRRAFSFDGGSAAPLPGLPGARRAQVGDDRATLDPRAGFNSYVEFARAVMRASPGHPSFAIDPRLAPNAALTSAAHREAGQDGYLVPAEYRDRIWERMEEGDGLINEIDLEPTSSNAVNDTVDESTQWGSTGIKAFWRSEGSAMTRSRQNVKPRSIVLHELYAFCEATDELLEDAPRLEARLTDKSAQAINYRLDEAIFEGDGNGKPLGFMNAACLVTVAKESSQSAIGLVALNVANMFSRMLAESVAGAGWWVNSDLVPYLMTMTLGDQPIWTPPSTGFQNAPGGILFGRPVRFSRHNKTAGTKGDIVLMNPKGYYGLRKGEIKSASSIHLYFDFGATAFRHTFRFGGQPHLSAAVSPKNGSATQSHFVTLATRP
jgi:HK97 family phage major capsid protein